MLVSSKDLEYSIYDSIDAVPEKYWGQIKTDFSITMGYQFWKTIENSKLADIECNYIVFYDQG